MRRFIAAFAVVTALFTSFSCTHSPEECDYVKVPAPKPIDTVKSYKIIIHKGVPADRVGLILDAADEWVLASSGAVVFEMTYGDFDFKALPADGEMRIYTEPKADKSSKTIGLATTWGQDDKDHPVKSRIWLQDDLDRRTYFLTAMHEVGHAIGLSHFELKPPDSIMYPYITDVGDHPTCVDRQKLCQLWGCEPGC